MKKILSVLLIIFVASIWGSCKKNTNTNHLNITLYNKPLDTIKKYVTGNWKLVYTDGGFDASKKYYDSIYFQLSATRIKQTFPASRGGVLIDTTINWIWELGTYTSGSYTYVLQCFDDRSYEYDYVPMQILNDTLILHENLVDGFYYHLIKNN